VARCQVADRPRILPGQHLRVYFFSLPSAGFVLAVQIRAARLPFPSVVFRNECEQARTCPRYQGRLWIFSAQVELLLTIIIKHGHLSAVGELS